MTSYIIRRLLLMLPTLLGILTITFFITQFVPGEFVAPDRFAVGLQAVLPRNPSARFPASLSATKWKRPSATLTSARTPSPVDAFRPGGDLVVRRKLMQLGEVLVDGVAKKAAHEAALQSATQRQKAQNARPHISRSDRR